MHGLSYSSFLDKLNKNNIKLNRKILSDLATNDLKVFESVIRLFKNNLDACKQRYFNTYTEPSGSIHPINQIKSFILDFLSQEGFTYLMVQKSSLLNIILTN